MDCCKYVNVFQGCGEIDLPKPQGIAAKWFFLKAGCGNTSPAALVPFGAMSVSPFSGGYPTGYGDHCPNSHSRPAKFKDGKKLYGFSHIHQSGTGAMGYYYNYAVVTPMYNDSEPKRAPADETAEPGYYSCILDDIKCELTADTHVAVHRYTFGREGGKITVDFSNNGLMIPGNEREKVYDLKAELLDGFTASASAIIEGIRIYFIVRANVPCRIADDRAIFDMNGRKDAQLFVSISVKSFDKANEFLSSAADFDSTRKLAYEKWNQMLSKIIIDADDEIKEIFYSNLYHSLVKPVDRKGESFIYDGDGEFCLDFNTLWDMYKTALPLVFLIDKEMSEKIVETLLCVGEKLGQLPNTFGITDRYLLHSQQARMLGDYVLLTAYRYGIKIDAHRMLKVIESDIFADNKTDFTVDGKCGSNTWMLDMADGCALAAEVAKETGDDELYQKLLPLSLQWKNAYDPETGLLSADSSYYEGSLYNYSFRQMVHMDERIDIAGGKENFVKLLDKFFGYGQPDVTLPTDPFNYAPVAEGEKLGRFEGFNNESDTEAPFSYIYADRHDRLCEIIRSGMKYMFTTGRGGLPGNNDSCALSSYYVVNAMGLFPVAGQDLFLLGSPIVDSAKIMLSSGKKLEIKVSNNSDKNIYVSEIKFNGKAIENYRLTATEILGGGTIEFTMSDTKRR